MSVEPATSRFWQAALQSGLMDQAALESCWAAIPPAKRTADAIDRRLARQAVTSGRLTLWQAQQIIAGRTFALRFGKYVLLDLLGQGGMGRVFLAKDSRLQRKVALKLLSRERVNNPRARARFEREGKVGAQLQHDNLVRIYDEGEELGLCYLVMEYIEGRNVAQILEQNGPLPASTAASIARQVAQGLAHAHAKGLIHRDVNPQNILVTRDGTAKLTDLGLAIDLDGADDPVTRDGATVGTFDYIAPEQARNSRGVDPRSDIYSLGCTLYQMLAGKVPFPTGSLPEKLYAHQLQEPRPISEHVSGVPRALEDVVSRMMAKKLEDRPQSAAEVVTLLEPFASDSVSLNYLGPDPSAELSSAESPVSPMSQVAPAVDATAPPTPLPGPPVEAPRPAPESTEPKSPYGKDLETTPIHPQGVPLRSVLAIDLGPETSLSESLSGVKPRPSRTSSSETGIGRLASSPKTLTVGALALAAASVLGGLGWWMSTGGEAATPDDRAKNVTQSKKGSNTKPATNVESPYPIAIRWADGRVEGVDDLRQAVAMSARAGGEVLIGPGELPEIVLAEGASAIALPANRPVTIRAARGTRPTLVVRTLGRVPLLQQTSASGKLTIRDLTWQVVTQPGAMPPPGAPRPLIDASSQVILERCTFVDDTGWAIDSVAVFASGLGATIDGCLFQGFGHALDLELYGNKPHRIEQCVFAWPQGQLVTRNGWAIRARSRGDTGKVAKILIDHCTVAGAGLLEIADPKADRPLEVEVNSTAIRTDHVLRWSSPGRAVAFPQGLVWLGDKNRFSPSRTNWVVLPPPGADGPPDGPTDLDGWRKAAKESETSAQVAVEFSDPEAMTRPDLDPARFAIEGAKDLGANPADVGPRRSE